MKWYAIAIIITYHWTPRHLLFHSINVTGCFYWFIGRAVATAAKSLDGRRRPIKTLPVVAIAAKPVVALSALAGGVSQSQRAASRLSIFIAKELIAILLRNLYIFQKGKKLLNATS
jgi:hypothetical protein